jgi:hypothetical protein
VREYRAGNRAEKDPEDRDLFWFAETAQEIWDGILHWHKEDGEPLPSMR